MSSQGRPLIEVIQELIDQPLSIFLPGKLYLANQHTSDHHLTRSRKVKAIRSQARLPG